MAAGSEAFGFLLGLLKEGAGRSRVFSAVCPLLAQVLKCEVELMARMAKTIDSFTQNQTRLVVIIDGLDACEQDKVLQMLDTVRLHCLQACNCHGWGSGESDFLSLPI